MNFLLSLYIFATVFGAGVVFIDLIGAATSSSDDGDSGDDGSSDGDSGSDGDDGGDFADDGGDAGDDGGDSGDDGGDGDDGSHTDHDSHGFAHDKGSYVVYGKKSKGNIVLKIISTLRSLVYFSFGFGAIGWFGLGTGRPVITTIIWSIVAGIVIMFVAKLVRRLQRHELDSRFRNEELLMAKAEVMVTIEKGKIGKVSIQFGDLMIDRYAKAKNPDESFAKGATVRVSEITDEYVYVE